MATELTLAIIKPDAVEKHLAGAILAHIEKAGFTIRGCRRTHLTRAQAEAFYAEHRERGFYGELTAFMSRGPVYVLALEAEGAILKWRATMGDTDPAQAPEGSIRKLYGASKGENATHGSDKPASAAREVAFFFPACDLV
ncbi:MAG: nucleoside-diphosphate kinase [Deltaproteobacteria bacterium]|nr:nucleoside-diphosphate kinase [Deltaproteobacteria bacterium]